MRKALAATIALVALTTLSACLAPEATTDEKSAAVESAEVVEIPVGVVATAEFVSLDGVTSGDLVGSYDGVNIVFDISDLTTPAGVQVLFVFADAELGVDDCFYDRYQIAWGDPLPAEPMSWPRFGPEEYSGDPTFFSTVAVLEYPLGQTSKGECGFRTLAVAPLRWTVPDLRPDLTVADSGERAGAGGRVTPDDNGAPRVYATSAGDTWTAIAARFGISTDDLLYLNPCRPVAYDPALAYADERLNLSKELRGARL